MRVCNSDCSERYQLSHINEGYRVNFRSMASPCELLIKSSSIERVKLMAEYAVTETDRIEKKYSRFIKGNHLYQINESVDCWQMLDGETSALIRFAKQCFDLSDGMFDITAGSVLKLWGFHQGAVIPSSKDIFQALKCVGFQRLKQKENHIFIPEGLSLDFGGIGKEYACDRLASYFALNYPKLPVLVNLGGDISCSVFSGTPWRVGVEEPKQLGSAEVGFMLSVGALASSGNSRRFITHNGLRYGHIINPVTGYPVTAAPLSVSVKAGNCLTAGMLSTIAMLHGSSAQDFLQSQKVEYKVIWSS